MLASLLHKKKRAAGNMSDIVTSEEFAPVVRRGGVSQLWTRAHNGLRAFAAHPDPLAEASNWVALTIGSHLPFWPLYIFWAAGWEALPTSLLTAAMTPLFLAIPLISRRSSVLSRIAMVSFGLINTVFTIWVLGNNSGTEVFFFPCAALAAFIFRHSERGLMIVCTAFPLMAWYILQLHPMHTLHQYNAAVAREIFTLNVFSIGALIVLFGWFQADIYRKMEAAK